MKLKKIDIPQVLQEDQGHLNDPNTTQFVSGQTIKLVIHPFAWFDPRNIGDHSITSEQQTSRVSRKKHVRHHKNYHVQRTQRAKKNRGKIHVPHHLPQKKTLQNIPHPLGFCSSVCPLFHLFAADLTFGLRKDDTNQVGSSSNGTLGIFWATHATDLGDPTLRGWRQYGGGENWMFKLSIGNIT